MATLNEHTSVLTAILSDISCHSDTNFIYKLSANRCQQQIRKNDRKNTLKQTKHQMKSQFVYKQYKERSRKSGSIQASDSFSAPLIRFSASDSFSTMALYKSISLLT